MRITINLATHPFVELRPLFARLRIAMAVLAVTAVGLGFTLHSMRGKAQVAQVQMDDLKAQTKTLRTERQTNEARMRQPQNQAVLNRARFLNDLFAAKSFSWTSVMMDLERVLPGGVQVTSIEPSMSANHDVSIRLKVSGDRDHAVELVRNLEQSQRFLAPRLSTETAQVQEQGRAVATAAQVGVPGGVTFDILSGYNPLPAAAASEPAEKSATPAPAAKGNEGARRAGAKAKAGAHKAAVGAKPSVVRPAKPVAKPAQRQANGGAH